MENQRNPSSSIAVAIAALAFSCGASAQTPGAPETSVEDSGQPAESEGPSILVHMDLAAAQALDAAMDGILTSDQVAMLRSVAHQQVAALTCEGFSIDPDRYRAEMNRIYYGEDGAQIDATPEELHEIEKRAMFGFGLAFGAQYSIAAYDEVTFCAHAEEERSAEGQDHIIWAAPDTEGTE